MDTVLVVRVIVLVISLAGCIALLFAGFRMAGVRRRKDPEDTTLHRIPKEKLMEHLASSRIDCLATLGAGDIDRFIEPIETLLRKRL